MGRQLNISVKNKEAGYGISDNLYGIFFEDINFAGDGGLNANMVNNYSFDGVYFSNEELKAVSDPLRYWEILQGTIESGKEAPLHENSAYARVSSEGNAVLSNLGFNGQKAHKDACAMSVKKGAEYLFEAWARPADYEGVLAVQVTDADGNTLAGPAEMELSKTGAWQRLSCRLEGICSAYGKLELVIKGAGSLDLDCVSLMDADYWNAGDPKWRYGKMRKDFVQALADLKPTFMRFPGGCIVEGQLPGNEYNWKDTVGELYERKSNYNLWSEKIDDGGYNQSYQIGFYEYFCLCEDLGMKPLPTLSVGLNCQIRSMQRGEAVCPNIPTDSEEFRTKIIAGYLDLIEFANGAPEDGKWAALRAEMGHPQPFGLERIGVGNENYDEVYFERFRLIEQAVHEKYPDMICILCGGVHPFYDDVMNTPGLDTVYRFAKNFKHVIVDEHSYHTPQWFEEQEKRFDSYDRSGAQVYFGEYAANGLLGALEETMHSPQAGMEGMDGSGDGGMRPMNESNQFDTALGEAAFLTGIERNGDIVAMASYAPLFNMVDCDQWNHNLINFNPKTLCLSVNYYVQKMFGANVGNRYLPFAGDLPEHMYCSVTEDEKYIYLKLVNISGQEAQISVQLPYAAAGAEMEALQSDALNTRNGLTFYSDAEYALTPQKEKLDVRDGDSLELAVQPYGVYVAKIEVR